MDKRQLNQEKIFFVCGALRSGSTLLHLILDHHPKIKNPGEFDFLFDKVAEDGGFPEKEEYLDWLSVHRIFQSKNLVINSQFEFSTLINSFIDQLIVSDCFLALNIHRNFDRIPYLFPEAKFIHLIRDPRDVARSGITMGWAGNVYYGIDHWIDSECSWQRLQKRIRRNQYLELRFESLILYPEKTLQEVCEFIGVPFSNSMLNYADSSSYDRPDASLVNQWKKKLSQKEIQYVEVKAGKYMKNLGYELSDFPPLSIGYGQKKYLLFSNKFYRLRFAIKRYGLLLVFQERFSKVFGMQEMNKRLTVVIINYKTPGLCIDCLQTLMTELEFISAKVVIVDNASNDGSVEVFQNWIDETSKTNMISIISSSENKGFSAGNNTGVKSEDSDYYLLLNSDTLVQQGAIITLLSYADSDESAGIVSPRLEWQDGMPQESCFKFHTPISELIQSAATGLVTCLFRKFVVAQPVCSKIASYEWTSFACVLIRSAVFEDIGLMDDGYFMYFEDVEFCYRARKAGWNIVNVPDAHVVHLRGGSSPVKKQVKLRKRLPRYYYQSRTRFFYQLYGYSGLLLANVFWTMGFFVASLRAFYSSSFISPASTSQWRDIWINFFRPLQPYQDPGKYDKA